MAARVLFIRQRHSRRHQSSLAVRIKAGFNPTPGREKPLYILCARCFGEPHRYKDAADQRSIPVKVGSEGLSPDLEGAGFKKSPPCLKWRD
jgi:hypothetical protein